MPFESSERFRVNANKRRVDGWLIYRCTRCGATWNREIVARRSPREIGADLLQRLEQNDAQTARRYAFDVAPLTGAGMRVEGPVPIRVERAPLETAGSLTIRIRMPVPAGVRLDRLLADELGLSRSAIQRLYKKGAIQTEPACRTALRKPVHDGQVIRIARDP